MADVLNAQDAHAYDDLAQNLAVGGVVPFSTLDWPGRLSAVCFLAGCPWRCPYCQNYILQDPHNRDSSWDEVRSLLEQRKGLLDGLVFSGGEPLAQRALPAAVSAVRDMGFEVALHTAGVFPDHLRALLPQLSWVGLDVKAPWDAYQRVTQIAGSGERARASLEAVVASGVDFEARTTWHPDLLSPDDLVAIGHQLAQAGVSHWAVQAYRPIGTNGSLPDQTVYPSDVPEEARLAVEHFVFRRS